MPIETISGIENLPVEVRNHIESLLVHPEKLGGLDVSIFFLKLDTFLFRDVLKILIKKFKAINDGKSPELDLIFVIDDLGEDDKKKLVI